MKDETQRDHERTVLVQHATPCEWKRFDGERPKVNCCTLPLVRGLVPLLCQKMLHQAMICVLSSVGWLRCR